MPDFSKYVDLPARILMSFLFLISAFGKVTGVAATQAYMAAYGVPAIFLWPSAALEFTSGLLLIIGLGIRPLSVVLAAWCLLTAAIFHTNVSDPGQMINLLKNFAMAGGFLMLAKNGSYRQSVDGRLASRV